MSGQHEQMDELEQSDQPDRLDAALLMTQPAVRAQEHKNGYAYGGPDSGRSRPAETGGHPADDPAPARQPSARSVFDPIPSSQRTRNAVDPAAPAPDLVTGAVPGNGAAQPPQSPADAKSTRNGVREAAPDPGAHDSGEPTESSTSAATTTATAAVADQPARPADQAALRPEPGSCADLRQRLDRLPYGHPSSPYHVDGERKPPPPRLMHLELAPPVPGPIVEAPSRSSRYGHAEAASAPADMPPQASPPAVNPPAEKQQAPGSPQGTPARADAEIAPPSRGRRARQVPYFAGQPGPATADGGPKPAAPDSVPGPAEPQQPNFTPTAEPSQPPAVQGTGGYSVPDGEGRTQPMRRRPTFTPTAASDSTGSASGQVPARPRRPAADVSELRPTASLDEVSDDQSLRTRISGGAKSAPAARGPGFNPDVSPPRLATDGSWTWGPARLGPDQVGVADDGYDRFRAAEGRDLFGSYVGSGLTTKLRQIEERLEHGSLDSHTEDHALLDIDVFRARFAEMLRRHPDRSPDMLASRVPGALSYAFIFGLDYYADGIVLVQGALEAQGFELQARKNSWSSAANRCVFTMWHDPLSELPFEVQFHTSASFEAQQLARTSVNLINDPRVAPEEAASLRSDLASAWAAVPSPPGNAEISDYRRYGSSGSSRPRP